MCSGQKSPDVVNYFAGFFQTHAELCLCVEVGA